MLGFVAEYAALCFVAALTTPPGNVAMNVAFTRGVDGRFSAHQPTDCHI